MAMSRFLLELRQEKLRDAEKSEKELKERFGLEEAKTVEMAAELLTLVNQKTHLDAVGRIHRIRLRTFTTKQHIFYIVVSREDASRPTFSRQGAVSKVVLAEYPFSHELHQLWSIKREKCEPTVDFREI